MNLTASQWRVAHMLAQGLNYAEIAAQTGMAHGTVKAHAYQALIRTGLRDRTQLALAVARGQVRGPALRRAA
jgi:DNA-binding NarL/FixJ family response regulator